MEALGAVALSSAIYAVLVLLTYLIFLKKSGCNLRKLALCVKAREIAVIAALVAAQSAIMALIALFA
ncbi:MAG: hypothetical protein TU35_003885 [Thermoproteus sp. AZ2]|uniref:Uncharacterized protein n=1 Tax=Thermoproteus sp. AZ2 TaxID=1609232 RepID=A0ACC6V0T6_9CREN